MPEPELSPSSVAGDPGSDNFWGFFYRVDVEALEEWANVTKFTIGGLGSSVKEPEITSNFRDFLLIMHGNNWGKGILRHTSMIKEQLKGFASAS